MEGRRNKGNPGYNPSVYHNEGADLMYDGAGAVYMEQERLSRTEWISNGSCREGKHAGTIGNEEKLGKIIIRMFHYNPPEQEWLTWLSMTKPSNDQGKGLNERGKIAFQNNMTCWRYRLTSSSAKFQAINVRVFLQNTNVYVID